MMALADAARGLIPEAEISLVVGDTETSADLERAREQTIETTIRDHNVGPKACFRQRNQSGLQMRVRINTASGTDLARQPVHAFAIRSKSEQPVAGQSYVL
jgi:hypothetical protein